MYLKHKSIHIMQLWSDVLIQMPIWLIWMAVWHKSQTPDNNLRWKTFWFQSSHNENWSNAPPFQKAKGGTKSVANPPPSAFQKGGRSLTKPIAMIESWFVFYGKVTMGVAFKSQTPGEKFAMENILVSIITTGNLTGKKPMLSQTGVWEREV